MNFNTALQDQDETALVVVPTMSLDVIRPQFEDFKAEALRIVTETRALTVQDDESLNIAVMLGGSAKKIVKAVEAQRKKIILEPQDFVKGVNSICNAITDNLDEAERVAKQKIGQHQARIELDRRKQEEAARKATEELQAKLRAEAEEANRKAREEAAKIAAAESERLRKIAEAEAEKRKASEAELAALREKLEADRITAQKIAEAEAAKHEIQAPTVLAPVIPVQGKVTRTDSGTSAHQRKVWTFEVQNASLVPADYKIVDEQLIKDAIKMGIREIPGVRIFEETKTILRS